ncbi:hypothetical protein AMTRI_Chr03g144040 [Amborella trichopoda]|uniref:ABC transporter domain-containing protein n=1 Tax=Amborella trichopoda TaxID=13333 RepID=W1NHW5_AMBTC|nr:ABC transporter G family member 14 [Amborella trichopoda]ERM94760.1 hypothetical protein AMTR_s00011p00258490 [Amborella trichopoda]|eukprot:XP_006878615.1 ABC transporter G family member 14 [Amborella trichopoda]
MAPSEQTSNETDGVCHVADGGGDPLRRLTQSGASSPLGLALCPVTLKFEDVGYKVKLAQGECLPTRKLIVEKTILTGLTGIVSPGEILAMLGPSGSGKTTLLTALGGRLPGKHSGFVTYNNHPFSSSMKRRIGFVTQDDVLYAHLTVSETLTFAALLRLPDSITRAKKLEQAEHVLNQLGLSKCKNTIIGGPLLRGVSGGERKRVSIGQEMLVNPSLLLLDEPTSGLDSTTAMKILTMVKGLAKGGRTVVTTIHQPSSRLYHMFDKVVVLSEGAPIYHGQASVAMGYFAAVGFSTPVAMNPADFLLDLANGIPPSKIDSEDQGEGNSLEEQDPKLVHQLLISAYNENISPRLKAELRSTPSTPNQYSVACRSRVEEEWGTSWWEQVRVLLKRGLKERKHEAFSGLRIFQVTTVSILSGLLWWHSTISHIQDQIGLLFFYSIFWGFFPLFHAVFAFPQERAILMKEQRTSSYYRLSSYFTARTLGDLPTELALPTLFVLLSYFTGGLKPTFTNFTLTLLVILLNVLVSQGLGLALGAVLMDVKKGTTLASVITLVFLLAGGYYVQRVPSFIAWLKYVSFSYYCYKLLLGVQYGEGDVYGCGTGLCRVVDLPAVANVGVGNKGRDVGALVVMMVGYRLIAYAALRRLKVR